MKKIIININFCSREEFSELENYLAKEHWDYEYNQETGQVIIKPHFCSSDEYQELENYLSLECWEYSKI